MLVRYTFKTFEEFDDFFESHKRASNMHHCVAIYHCKPFSTNDGYSLTGKIDFNTSLETAHNQISAIKDYCDSDKFESLMKLKNICDFFGFDFSMKDIVESKLFDKVIKNFSVEKRNISVGEIDA